MFRGRSDLKQGLQTFSSPTSDQQWYLVEQHGNCNPVGAPTGQPKGSCRYDIPCNFTDNLNPLASRERLFPRWSFLFLCCDIRKLITVRARPRYCNASKYPEIPNYLRAPPRPATRSAKFLCRTLNQDSGCLNLQIKCVTVPEFCV